MLHPTPEPKRLTTGARVLPRLVRPAGYGLKAWLFCSVCMLAIPYASAQEVLPQGGQFVAGSGSIGAAQNGTMNIQQNSAAGVINWNSFSIGTGNQVNIMNGTGATLNRVTGADISRIDGQLNATGSVYLMNPSGVVIGPSGRVDTGGSFLATTKNVTDDAFMGGGAKYFGGASDKAVRNMGTIRSEHGDVSLLAQEVENSGSISAANGTATLAAGSGFTLQDGGVNGLQVAIDTATAANVTHSGRIDAVKAQLEAAGGNVFALAGNNGGVIRATGVENRNGQVWLSARGGNVTAEGNISATNADGSGGKVKLQADQGTTMVSGNIDASGKSGNGKGGEVALLGKQVGVTGNATVKAQGKGTGKGGSIYVGGDIQSAREGGAKTTSTALPEARAVYLGKDTKLQADGGEHGDGGLVSLWAAEATRAYGDLTARGGDVAGNGGYIETSGRWFDLGTKTPDAGAAHGNAGTWLIDPYDLTIVAGNGNINAGSDPDFASSADSAELGADLITAALGSSNVTVSTGAGGTEEGTLRINSAINYTGGTGRSLTFNAHRDIQVNSAITSSNAALNLNFNADSANTGLGAILVNNNLSTNGGNLNFLDDTILTGSGALTLATAGGNVDFDGEVLLRNASGITINAGSGNITFDSRVNSANNFALSNTTYTWTQARNHAATGDVNTAPADTAGAATGDSYLATITSRAEATLANTAAAGNQVWFGGSDAGTEGQWRWVTGPEGLEGDNNVNDWGGRLFLNGNRSGTPSPLLGYVGENGAYVAWNAGEPNDAMSGEHALQGNWGVSKLWNDYPFSSNLYYVQETNAVPTSLNLVNTGTVTFNGAVGGEKVLDSLTFTSPSAINVGANITTQQSLNFPSQVNITGDSTIRTTGAGTDVVFNNDINYNGVGSASLGLTATRDVVLQGRVYDSAAGGDQLNLTLNANSDNDNDGAALAYNYIRTGGGSVTSNSELFMAGSDITTSGGAQTYNSNVLLRRDAGVNFASGAGNIVFNGRIDSANESYALVNDMSRTWDEARRHAQTGSNSGTLTAGYGTGTGETYLATVTSRAENSIIRRAIGTVSAWLGGSDVQNQGTWRWVTGPEGNRGGGNATDHLGLAFSTGSDGAQTAQPGLFAPWNPGEPNGGTGENFLEMIPGPLFNDLPSYSTRSYVRETNAQATALDFTGTNGQVTFNGNVGDANALASIDFGNASQVNINSGVVNSRGSMTIDRPTVIGAGANTVISASGANQDIAVSADITKANGAASTLALQATRDVTASGGVDIGSSGGALNLTLNADSDSSNGGQIALNGNAGLGGGTTIATNGGSLTMGGGSTPASGYATGYTTGAGGEGVALSATTITTGGGNVTLNGQGATMPGQPVSHGIALNQSSISSGTGSITLNGIGGSGSTTTEGPSGIMLSGSGTALRSSTGTITLNGTGGANSNNSTGYRYQAGVRMQGDATVETTGDGIININGTAGTGGVLEALADADTGNVGFLCDDECNILTPDASGQIHFTGDGLVLDGQAGGLSQYRAGLMTIRPATLTGNILLGSTADSSAALALSANELGLLDAGTLRIGRTDGSGSITASGAAATSLADTTTLYGMGGITIGNTNRLTANSLLLRSAGGTTIDASVDADTVAVTTTGTTTARLRDDDGFAIGTVDGVNGITATTVSLATDSTVSQTQGIGATNLVLRGGATNTGVFNLNSVNNSFDVLSATGIATLRMRADSGFSTGTADSVTGISVNALARFLLGNGATMEQASGAAITATNLMLAGGTGRVFDLTDAGNDFGTVAADASTVRLRDDSGFAIGTVETMNGLTASTLAHLTSNGGTITQSQAITAPALALSGTGGSFALGDANNAVTTLASNSGALDFRDDTGFDIGTADSVVGVNSNGEDVAFTTGALTQSNALQADRLSINGTSTVTLNDADNRITTLGAINRGGAVSIRDGAGGLSIDGATATHASGVTLRTVGNMTVTANGSVAASGSGNNIVLETTGSFINNGTGAAPTGGARFLVYQPLRAGETRGSMAGSSRYNRSFINSPPAGVADTGNLYMYTEHPTLTFTADDITRLYGQANPTLTYTISGLRANDAASVNFATDALQGSNVGDYDIEAVIASLVDVHGYQHQYVDGTLTINPAPLTIRANDTWRYVGLPNPSFSQTLTGLYSGDSLSDLTPILLSTAAWRGSASGDYAINVSGGLSPNYVVTHQAGNLNVVWVEADGQDQDYADVRNEQRMVSQRGAQASQQVMTAMDVHALNSRPGTSFFETSPIPGQPGDLTIQEPGSDDRTPMLYRSNPWRETSAADEKKEKDAE